ncbi:hypothetical protein EJ06DRAFT_329508 [Trichodelitschia bisporula]|uniref:cAMP-independent regulatory protein pac2 n=1 Tax=Trichodelitschia bisporula TaxID=703511 RepID=A0A6G1I1T1_9PEZI|nr:hypothetical protein EJ06DRAFT_329508 [Trichodelitschia bisporula]
MNSKMETYHGHVRTPQDAIILFEACRIGLLPRVQRRLSEKERQQIKSGSVFVWDEREAGMRRWTDGKSWSASRVSGSFLTYREMEGKRGGNGFAAQASTPVARKPANGNANGNGNKSTDGNKTGDSDSGGDDGPDGYRYKLDGLMKQSFSITTQDGRHLHLISYFGRHPSGPMLKQPSSDPALRHIIPQKGLYPDATINESAHTPPVTRGPMTSAPYHPAPPQMVVSAYPYHQGPPPGYAFAPGPHPQMWPASPMATPPGHYYYAPHLQQPPHGQPYPPPHYVQAHPHPHPGYPPPGPGAYDRPPPPPHGPPPQQHSLPPLALPPNGAPPPPQHSQYPQHPQHYPPHSSPARLPYHQPPTSGPPTYSRPSTSDHHPHPPKPGHYQPTPPAPPQNGHHRPPTPPQSAPSAPQSAPLAPTSTPTTGPALSASISAPAQLSTTRPSFPSTDSSGTPTAAASSSRIPSINALINGDGPDGEKGGSRSGSRSPGGGGVGGSHIREIPDAMAAGGLQRDKSDLKRLDSQLLKS